MHLFSEGSINGIRLKTRIDRSATWEGMCDGEGSPSDRLIDFYRTSAKAASD
jgi:2,4-dienoyl-CoA reductase-like NADH-dependent reductase (Old Yellow Enzyme family)